MSDLDLRVETVQADEGSEDAERLYSVVREPARSIWRSVVRSIVGS